MIYKNKIFRFIMGFIMILFVLACILPFVLLISSSFTSEVALAQNGYSFIQVKTAQMGKYEAYDKTNRFYLALGFKEFEVFPNLWDEWNPCQVYIMAI